MQHTSPSRRRGLSLMIVATISLLAAPRAWSAGSDKEISTESKATISSWPQWQGPDRTNVSSETGLLQKWPDAGPPLVWEVKGMGGGFSGVSIAGGHIYSMGDIDNASCVFALEQETGKKIWSTKLGAAVGGNGYPGTRGTPTVDGELVYAMNQFGDIACVEAATGKVVWNKSMTADFGGKMMSKWGYAESLLVDGGNVICTPGGPDGTIIALDKKTGQPVWRSKGLTDSAAYSSLIIEEIGGVRQYIGLTSAHVFGISAADGGLLWEAARIGKTAVIPTPVYHDNDVFVTSDYGAGAQLFHISADAGKLSAAQAYTVKDFSVHHGGVVLVGDYIYGSSDPGILKCLRFKDGKEMWKDREPGKGAITAADNRLYFRNESTGTMYLIEITPDAYKLVSQFDQPDRSAAKAWPHPVICGGKLYLRDEDVLLCYDVKTK